MAIAYVAFRLLESVFFILHGLKSLSLVSFCESIILSDTSSPDVYNLMGEGIHAGIGWNSALYVLVFTIGALMFYFLLYKSRILSRFISLWGFIAAALLFTATIVGMVGVMPLEKAMLYFGPLIALNELTLSIWLIVKVVKHPEAQPQVV